MPRFDNAVAIGIGMDTREFRRDVAYANRLIGQSKAAFRDLQQTVNLLNLDLKDGTITENEHTAAVNKAVLASEKRSTQLRKEAEAATALSQGLNKINTAGSSKELAASKAGADAWSAGVKNMGRTSEASALAIRVNQAALAGWANGLKQVGTSKFSQELKVSKAGADAWSAGVRNMADAAKATALAIRESQAALSGWANGLKRVNLSKFAQELKVTRASADAWAAGMRNVANASREAAAASAAAKTALRGEGTQFLSQFETAQQRVNRALAEASRLYRQGAISAKEYAAATRQIRHQNSVLVRGFAQFRGAVTTLLGPLVLVISAYEALKKALTLSAELDAARAKFEVFLGSAVEAERLLGNIREFTSSTPVTFVGGQRAVTTMLQFGVAANTVFTSLKQIAEITAGNTARMEALALAFAQSQAAGRLMGQELLQMVNAGFNPLKVISEQTGVSLVDLKKKMEEGGISSEAIAKAFADATAEGGRFHGLLDKIAKEVPGKFSVAQSEVELLGTAIGDALKPVTHSVLDVFIGELKASRSLLEEIQELLAMLPDGWQGGVVGVATEAIKGALGGSGSAAGDAVADMEKIVGAVGGRGFSPQVLSNLTYGLTEILKGTERTSEEMLSSLSELESRFGSGLLKRTGLDDDLAQLREQFKDVVVAKEQFRALNDEYRKSVAELKKTKATREDFDALLLEFYENAGGAKGLRFSEGGQKLAAEAKARQEERDQIKANTDRAAKAFKSAQDEARKAVVQSQYGDRAEAVLLLRTASVDDERDAIDDLIKQGASYREILAAANAVSQAEAGRLDLMQQQVELLEAQDDFTQDDFTQAQKDHDKAFAAELANLESKAKFLEEIVALGKEDARIRQLLRDEDLSLPEALDKQAAEERIAALEQIRDLREEADKLQAGSSSYDKLIASISQLQQQLQLGFIDQALFDRERDKLIDGSQRNATASTGPRAIQADSAEAFALQANLQARTISEQIRLADRAFLVQKATADATKKTAEVLDDIKDDLGVLPTP